MNNQAGNAILLMSTGTGVTNALVQADMIISIIVGVLSAVGILYSIIWHRVRIKQSRKKRNVD